MCSASLIFFFLELLSGLQSALVQVRVLTSGGVLLGSSKSVLSDGCLDDIVIADILLFEGLVRFYSYSGVSEGCMEHVQKKVIQMKGI